MKNKHKFPYLWTLQDANFTKDKGKVFSCFACGGGSTMGYKLAGFDVIGFNEIDPKMAECYIENHKPKYAYIEPIQTFKDRQDLPKELYELDILDGSPPCSSFSMAGNREKDWGKEKKFREGQSLQVLDTLFFDFIDLAERLQPKIVIAENVKGLLMGNAKSYVREIYKSFEKAGYYVQHFLLEASKMGVPQRRERVFFIALRKDLAKPFLVQKDFFTIVPKLELEFNEKEIPFSEISDNNDLSEFPDLEHKDFWLKMKEGESVEQFFGFGFNHRKVVLNKVMNTVLGVQRCSTFKVARNIHPTIFRAINDKEFILSGSFPMDYNFGTQKSKNFVGYLIGMSVPPVMTAQIASNIYEQWISKF